ncbi:uncharacterized protein PV06_03872 [Exophiala oligosperma]|uniref:Wax synthase domain-containing protein n=1 Tax=Exophiala oligosperma TaxID=215243 RepID=A0A0D2DSR1_9EURO|nr:uncharacterized protein PV06_03872 [Exophiala oligosperma]KIW45485.1 hypothetical protein PV06_03872 [Exophiala oligosperma]
MVSNYISLYRQTLAERQRRYNAAIGSKEFTPFLYPWDALPSAYLLLALLIAPRLPRKQAVFVRLIAFLLTLTHSLYLFTHRRTIWLAGGYGIGLINQWGIIMAAALLLFNDPAQSFRRLETRSPRLENGHSQPNGGSRTPTSADGTAEVDLRKRRVPGIYTSTNVKQVTFPGSTQPATRPYDLVWQGFPHGKGVLHAVDWVADLVTSFRGPNWGHRIPTLGGIDGPVPRDSSARHSKCDRRSKTTAVPKKTLQALRGQAIRDFVVGYLLLDLLKTTMITDPYFLGVVSLDSPTLWPWLSAVNETMPIATRLVRLFMSISGVISALTLIFSLSPLFFAFILPSLVDVSHLTKSPLLEPWMYAPFWYPLTTSVLHTGLAGFWGKFWHQMFRFGISEPARFVIEGTGIDKRGNTARMIQLLVAFGLSGSIHAAGSYTTFSIIPSRPFSGPLLFFLSQGIGIYLQSLSVKAVYKYVPHAERVPLAVREVGNLLYVMVYLFFTGPLLADDFARCGLWLFEPVPISFLRGLGFGPGGKDEGWWAWYQEGSKTLGWYEGDRWWTTGVAIY